MIGIPYILRVPRKVPHKYFGLYLAYTYGYMDPLGYLEEYLLREAFQSYRRSGDNSAYIFTPLSSTCQLLPTLAPKSFPKP